MADLRIATRGSQLALAQARLVADALGRLGVDTDLVKVTTTGDRDRTTAVATLTEVGAFVRAVQLTVLDGEAELAVHSAKDLPVAGLEGLEAVYPAREAPWDAMCGNTLDGLAHGATVGTGSPRRAAQLRLLRPDLAVRDIRGNVDTRLAKLDRGEYDALVLAAAGLRRLGLEDRADQVFDPAAMVPAAAQGALAVEAATGSDALDLLRVLDHPATRTAVEAERAVLEISGAGCRAALGVHATVDDETINLAGFVENGLGARRAEVVEATPRAAAQALCAALEIGA